MSKSEEARKVLFGCMVIFAVGVFVAWLQTNGYIPKY